jgi:hypothetical protein
MAAIAVVVRQGLVKTTLAVVAEVPQEFRLEQVAQVL